MSCFQEYARFEVLSIPGDFGVLDGGVLGMCGAYFWVKFWGGGGGGVGERG